MFMIMDKEATIILQSRCRRSNEDIKTMEEDYSKKLNAKVVILNSDVELKAIKIQNNNIDIDKATEEVAKTINERERKSTECVINIKCDSSDIDTAISKIDLLTNKTKDAICMRKKLNSINVSQIKKLYAVTYIGSYELKDKILCRTQPKTVMIYIDNVEPVNVKSAVNEQNYYRYKDIEILDMQER